MFVVVTNNKLTKIDKLTENSEKWESDYQNASPLINSNLKILH
jgi:hypothetical protein